MEFIQSKSVISTFKQSKDNTKENYRKSLFFRAAIYMEVTSSDISVTKGVPQGSTLEPLPVHFIYYQSWLKCLSFSFLC